jgi:hypothetical protein
VIFEPGIATFQFNDGVNEFLIRSFRARLAPALEGKQHAVLRLASTWWRCRRVEGFRTMAERRRRVKSVHKPAMIRSAAHRLGARLRPRLRMSS